MEPSRCSVLVVDRSCAEQTYQPSRTSDSVNPNPFLAPSGDRRTCEANNNQGIDDLITIFLNVFDEVITVPSGTKALNALQNRNVGCPPTILLIDIDHTESVSRDLYTRRDSYHFIDGVPLSEIHTTVDTLYGMELLKYISSEISKGTLERVIPIVYSSNENSDFMLDCLNKGAVDYLLKPISPEVAKTIFLHVHRMNANISGTRSPRSLEYPRPIIRKCSTFEERLYEVFAKDKWLTDTIIQYYTPPSPVTEISHVIRLNSAADLEKVNSLKKKLVEWEFDSHKLSEDDLLRCVCIIFEHAIQELDELRKLDVGTEQLHKFLLAIRQAYHDCNPYHNFTHAVDVLQAIFHFLCKMELLPSLFRKRQDKSRHQQHSRPNDLLKDSDVFALLLASIGHDVGHPGVNNDFLVQSQNPLAQLYNDKSVLESFHSMTLFNLMQKYGFKIYENEPPKYSEFRRIVVNAILATDMQLHNRYVEDIRKQAQRFGSLDFDPSSKLEEEKNTIIGALIKCADISNTARPYHIASSWSNVLLQEFVCQGDLQRKLGLPVAPANDRGVISQPDSQIGFIDFCALPLFKSVTELLPEIEFTIQYLEMNKREWLARKEADSDNCSLRHNSSGNDSGVIVVSLQNSPISISAAKTMQPISYLRPLPDGPGSEVHSDDCGKSLNQSTGESEVPLTQQIGGRSRRKSMWSFFAKNRRGAIMNAVGNNSDYQSNETSSSILCCNVQ